MKQKIMNIIDLYLREYPDEVERLKVFMEYLKNSSNSEISDWNNFNGHIVAGGFIYSKSEQKFLLLYHKDLKMYLYPGGHVDSTDEDPLFAVKREIKEETGLDRFNIVRWTDNELVPFDLDIQTTKYNERLNLPAHYHFDFRYIFVVDKITHIEIDETESRDYRWVGMEELKKCRFSNRAPYTLISKIEKILKL